MSDPHILDVSPQDQVAVVEQQEGRAGKLIVITFLGGVLLITALIARAVFTHSAHSDLLAIVAAIMLGMPLVVQAFRDLLRGRAQMTTLAALAVVAAFATERFVESGAIAFLMSISMLIEQRTALGARKSIESLIRLTPTRAHRVTPGGEEEVEAKDLRPGDVVIVRPGDNIPGDGVVVRGDSTVNQANITGESLPIDKTIEDEVFGGTINITGVIEVRITKAGRDTTLGRVKDLILQAEETRTPVMRLIDRYAYWYLPVILALTGIVLFFTVRQNKELATERAIAMLVIGCAPSLILAAPTAMIAALSAAARLGVLVKNVANLETARNLTAIVFDKTGTLTTGQLSVTKLTPAEGVEGAHLLRIAASAEQDSKHPVARAVVEVARRARLELAKPDGFEEITGRGVRARFADGETLIGRETWLNEQGIDCSSLKREESQGLSLLFVAHNGKLLGWVGLEDKTRPDAARAMDTLRQSGLKKLVMVTGDRWSVAKRVAAEMHCTDVQAEVLPAQKLDLVDALRSSGHTVAVVGDGVNDAPALAAGDISIAMGAAGSDVAIHSASIALMNNNLNRIPFLVRLSRRAFNIVGQNLAFAIIFIVALEALAAMGYLDPVLAAALHLVSSFVVIFNSARLVRSGEDLDQADVVVDRPRATPNVAPVSVS